jgi:hypothetical protein
VTLKDATRIPGREDGGWFKGMDRRLAIILARIVVVGLQAARSAFTSQCRSPKSSDSINESRSGSRNGCCIILGNDQINVIMTS